MSLPKFKIKLGNFGGNNAKSPAEQGPPQPSAPQPPFNGAQPSPAEPAPSEASQGAGTSLAPAAPGGFKIKVKLGNASSLPAPGLAPPVHRPPKAKRPAPDGFRPPGPKRPKIPGARPGRPPGPGGPKRKRPRPGPGMPIPEFAPPGAFQPGGDMGYTGGGAYLPGGGPAPKLKLKVTASMQPHPAPLPHMPPMPRRRGRPPKSLQNMGDRPNKDDEEIEYNVNVQPREYSLRNVTSAATFGEDGLLEGFEGAGGHYAEISPKVATPTPVEIVESLGREPKKEEFDRILQKVAEKDTQKLFEKPVTEANAPNYFEIIKNPMDLSTMRTKNAAGEYKTWEDFEKDLLLIFDNALTYNTPGDKVWKMANRLRVQAVKIHNTVKIGKKLSDKPATTAVVSRRKNAAQKAHQRMQRDQERTKARQEQRAALETKILKRAGVTSFAVVDDEENLKNSLRRPPGDDAVSIWGALGGGSNGDGVAWGAFGKLTLQPSNPTPSAAAVAASIARFASKLVGKAKEIVMGPAEIAKNAPDGRPSVIGSQRKLDARNKYLGGGSGGGVGAVAGSLDEALPSTLPAASVSTQQQPPPVAAIATGIMPAAFLGAGNLGGGMIGVGGGVAPVAMMGAASGTLPMAMGGGMPVGPQPQFVAMQNILMQQQQQQQQHLKPK